MIRIEFKNPLSSSTVGFFPTISPVDEVALYQRALVPYGIIPYHLVVAYSNGMRTLYLRQVAVRVEGGLICLVSNGRSFYIDEKEILSIESLPRPDSRTNIRIKVVEAGRNVSRFILASSIDNLI